MLSSALHRAVVSVVLCHEMRAAQHMPSKGTCSILHDSLLHVPLPLFHFFFFDFFFLFLAAALLLLLLFVDACSPH
jgi:hypothetical protein